MHLRTEVDLEVLCIVEDIEEGTALVKLGDAGEKKKVRWMGDPIEEDNKDTEWGLLVDKWPQPSKLRYEIRECMDF